MEKHLQIIPRSAARAIGHNRYFTGRPCKHGHISERRVSSAQCIDCLKESWAYMPEEKKRKELDRMSRLYLTKGGRESSRERSRERRESNPERQANYIKSWRENNKERCREYARVKMRRKRSTPEGKAEDFCRKCISRTLSGAGRRSKEILGYTKNDLVEHIEKQFLKGMSWENHGEWHIDHITPISSFLENGIEDPKLINALSNLRPIWARDNLLKSRKTEFLL